MDENSKRVGPDLERGHMITVAETASRLRLSLETTRRLIRRGELPHYRIGRRILVDPAALGRWLKASALDTQD